jgi:hypothetical protein
MTQPLPSQVGTRLVGTFSFGVSRPTYMSNRVIMLNKNKPVFLLGNDEIHYDLKKFGVIF